MTDRCADCGTPRDDEPVWMAPDRLWEDVSGFSERGYLCYRCFDRLALAHGMFVCWVPVVRIADDPSLVQRFPWEPVGEPTP